MQNRTDRFKLILEYIERNLDSELQIEQLSQLACLSKYHFHRQCSAFFGIPVKQVIRLMRLKRAAFQLAYRQDQKILDIALVCGYESHEAFSRVFKKHFDQNPMEFRQSPDWTFWQEAYQPVLNLRVQIMNHQNSPDVEIIDFPETPIAVLEHRGSPQSLSRSIGQFIQWRKRNQLPPSKNRTFNLVYDDPQWVEPQNYRLDLCCEIHSPILENDVGIQTATIPAGKCARIRHIGSEDTLGHAVEYLYSTWLEQNAYQLRDFPLLFERVSFFPDVSEHETVTDVYLPIK